MLLCLVYDRIANLSIESLYCLECMLTCLDKKDCLDILDLEKNVMESVKIDKFCMKKTEASQPIYQEYIQMQEFQLSDIYCISFSI